MWLAQPGSQVASCTSANTVAPDSSSSTSQVGVVRRGRVSRVSVSDSGVGMVRTAKMGA